MKISLAFKTTRTSIIFTTIIALFLALFVLAISDSDSGNYPASENYAPNFWFDSEEKYYPANPLDFYYDENLNELSGKEAREKYDSLSLKEKLKNFKVFYNIVDSGNEIVYQYWLFYVYNDFDNKHFGDWESVFVFVNKDTTKINRVVGSAHIGNTTKIAFANNELKNPGFQHTAILVEKGSHANIPDGNNNGLFEKTKDISNPNSYGFLAFTDWSTEDQLHGQKIFHDNPNYKLLPLEQIENTFKKKYPAEKPLISKEKSPSPEARSIKFFNKKFSFSLGGSPPQNAWLKKEYKDSNEVRPITTELVLETAQKWAADTGQTIQITAANIFKSAEKLLIVPLNFFGANVGEQNLSVQSVQLGQSISELNVTRNGIVTLDSGVQSEKSAKSGPENPEKPEKSKKPTESISPELADSDNDDQEDIKYEAELAARKKLEESESIQRDESKKSENLKAENKSDETEQPEKSDQADISEKTEQLQSVPRQPVYQLASSASSGAKNDYSLPPLKISEAGAGWNSGENEFVEIYNPNDKPITVNSDNFKLKLADSGNQITAKRITWSKNTVPAKGYFLLAAGDLANNQNQAIIPDATFSAQLTDVSGVIITDGEDNVKDKLSWGKPDKPAPSEATEGTAVILNDGLKTNQSLSRKKDFLSNSIDTNNNSADFEILTNPNPTNSQNQTLYLNPPQPEPPQEPIQYPKILITEIQTGPAEFIEIFNTESTTANLNGWHLSYFPATTNDDGTPKYNWSNPYRNKLFPNPTAIPAKTHYLVGLEGYPAISGNPNSDWQAYETAQLNNSGGAIAIFPFDPTTKTQEQARSQKIDAVGWGISQLSETASATIPQNSQSMERKKDANNNYIDTNNNLADFQIKSVPAPTNSKNETYQQPPDITPPDISFSPAGDYFITKTNFSLDWSSQAQDIVSFDIEYKIGQSGSWQLWETNNVSNPGQRLFSAAQDETTYYFRARAKDQSGNQSQWSEISAEINTKPIVVNEIAWMGTSASSNDEWIELYNRTNSTIPLNNWTLKSQDGIPTINLAGSISPKSYFLLERTNDSTISDIIADQIYTTGEMVDTGEQFELRDPNQNLIDYIPTWYTGNNASKKTMERINFDIAGNEISNWGTNDGIIINGKDANNNALMGTPRSKNSTMAATIIDFILSQDVVWTKANGPYKILGADALVDTGATLTIEAGVEIIFVTAQSFEIRGTLKILGTPIEPVVFTGDNKIAGDWQKIKFTQSQGSLIENAVFQYGGAGYTSGNPLRSGMLYFENSSVTIKNSKFQTSKNEGIYSKDSVLEIQNSEFDGNGGAAILIDGGAVNISDSKVQNNKTGIYIISGVHQVKNSIIQNNTSPAVYMELASQTVFEGNSAINNSLNGVYVPAGTISRDTMWYGNLPYVIYSVGIYGPLTVTSSATLTLNPGAIVKSNINDYRDTIMQINGNLKSRGTSSQPIVFTSFRDDFYGGDTNNDGSATTPAPGNWKNIIISASQTYPMENTIFRYGGSEQYKGMVYIENSSITIRDSRFDMSKMDGLILQNTEAEISGSQFNSNAESGLVVSGGSDNIHDSVFDANKSGIFITNGSQTIKNNVVENSLQGAIYINGPAKAASTIESNTFSGNGINGVVDM